MNRARVECVLRHMERLGLSQLIVSETAAVYYLTGLWVEPHERMLALWLSADGSAVLFGNEIFGLAPDLSFVTHADGEDPLAQLAQTVRPGTIGIDKQWPSRFLIGLLEKRSDIKPVVGSAPIDLARMCKDAQEIALLRQASAINDQVVAAGIAALRDGVSELEIASAIGGAYGSLGADSASCEQLVCFGANATDPHHAAGRDRLERGDGVVLDLFTPIQRYWCDMTRTVFWKTVSDRQKKVYETVRRANEAGIAAVRLGAVLCEIDAAARRVIEDAGFGKYFTHRLGHGIGLTCHEPPDVSAASEMTAQPGMVFSIEPGIYLPGECGVRIEDLVLVTEDGCEVLNHAPKELQVCGL